MSEQAELAFVKNYVNILSAQPVTFANDHQVPPEESLKKVPVLQVGMHPSCHIMFLTCPFRLMFLLRPNERQEQQYLRVIPR